MLRVVIAGEGLNGIKEHVEACKDLYTFEMSCFPLSSCKQVVQGIAPLLVFVEAPVKERGKTSSDTWILLQELQEAAENRLIRAFVVSTGHDFDSEEAQKAWMKYSTVIGYDLHNHLSLEVVLNANVIGRWKNALAHRSEN